jgi:predicted AAA+ superfamily ATPase
MENIKTPHIDAFSFYRSLLDHPILSDFKALTDAYASADNTAAFVSQYRSLYFNLKAQMLEYAFDKDEDSHYSKQPWCDFIISQIISDENPLTLLFERGIVSKQHPFYKSMFSEFAILSDLYHFDWDGFLSETDMDNSNIFSSAIFFPIPPHDLIDIAFQTRDLDRIFTATNKYIAENGLGVFENHVCFKVSDTDRLTPIAARKYKSMDDLVGYDHQKEEIIANTASFIHSYTGLNVLLQGDMGTGKSTMVKALLRTFKGTKLRMIEMKKEQVRSIPVIITEISKRPYPFILFIDDLSFDDKESDYKLFKNILEGSLEESPKNVLIYATSNKRHLVSETRSERTDAIHTKDILEEKLSLSSRFGLVLNFTVPNQNDYLAIVSKMAQTAGITIPKARLESQAIQWELRHLNRSGRTAEQFIEYLLVNGEKA